MLDVLQLKHRVNRMPLERVRERVDELLLEGIVTESRTPFNRQHFNSCFAEIEALRRRYEDVLEDILRAGHRAGQFSIPDSKLATMALIAMLTGVTNWYREGGRLRRHDVEAIYVDMALKSVGALAQP